MDLPIDPLLPEICATLARAGRLVLEGPPGAGQATRVPIALLVTRVGGQMSSLLDLEEASGFQLLLDPQVLAPLLALIGLVGIGLVWRRRTNRAP